MLRLLLRGLTALVALALLLVGLPGVLAVGTLAVTRSGNPANSGIVDLLTQPDQGNLFLWALVVIGWLAWLCFAVSVVVEIPAQLRGRSARRILALGWSQRMAGTLVGAVLALLPTAGAALAAAPASVTTTVGAHAPVAVTAAQGVHAGIGSAASSTSAPKPEPPTYTVRNERPADSLWSIAESRLGSGARWHEIARLNQGRVMDAAGRRFDADRPIQPGWVLLMPADATSPVTPPTANTDAEVKVEAGDSLSAIAQRELGNADEWPALFAANKGAEAPDGVRLENPDVIEPGMVLTVPSTASAPPTTTAPVAAPPTTTPPSATPPSTVPPTTAPPSTTRPTTPPPTHSAAPTHDPAPT
ncbi:LysM peptidoglycan-binding domain-containing protein, partial [Streptacidiphilus carbonis]|uniref:LysM peptidoglycan-binding domain-containing protein n=1 Tax=Streptacidiphilus carbonis TaxID=105422 RepID=UPI0005A8852B